eukprot:1054711-Pleurochrysis_carterae.AAC.1
MARPDTDLRAHAAAHSARTTARGHPRWPPAPPQRRALTDGGARTAKRASHRHGHARGARTRTARAT